MRIAPIIHTRTFSCDFNAEFLVRPDSFMDSDIKWARRNVLGATGEIDGLQGIRWLISDNGKYRMAGVVGFLKNICLKCQLSEDDRLKSEELFCDDKGRLVYAFIGIVIDKHHNDNYGSLSLDYLWKIYLNEIHPIWKRTYQEIILEGFTNIDIKSVSNTVVVESARVGLKDLYEANASIDYELFLNFLCDGNKTDFSFCSNILDFNMVKQSGFSIITTSKNIITRITRENVDNSRSRLDRQPTQGMNSGKDTEPLETSEIKKKSIVALKIGLVILSIVILILLLIKKMDLEQNFGQQIISKKYIEMISQLQFKEMVEIMYML